MKRPDVQIRLSHFNHHNDSKQAFLEPGHPLGEVIGQRRTRKIIEVTKRQEEALQEGKLGHLPWWVSFRDSQRRTGGKKRLENYLEKTIQLGSGSQEIRWDDSVHYANSAINSVTNLLFSSDPALKDKVGLRNATSITSNSLEYMIDIMLAPVVTISHVSALPKGMRRSKFVDALQHRETVRSFLLAVVAAQLEARSRNNNMEAELVKIQQKFEQDLFEGPFGYTQLQDTYSIHDNVTNEVVSLRDTLPESVDPHHHVKHFARGMRVVEEVGSVLTNIRPKSRESEIIKTLKKAVTRDNLDPLQDAISVAKDVQDSMGIMFVVKGTTSDSDPRIATLQKKVENTIKDLYKDSGEVTIESDPQRGDNTQSRSLNYQKYFAHIPGFDTPIELIFFNEADYINNDYRIGVFDEKERRYTGEAHILYEQYRALSVLPYLFPEQVDEYKGLTSIAYQAIDETATNLLQLNRVNIPKKIAA